jgi:hypothetical protein
MEQTGEHTPRTRKNRPSALNANVAIKAIGAERTISVAQAFSIHPNLVSFVETAGYRADAGAVYAVCGGENQRGGHRGEG